MGGWVMGWGGGFGYLPWLWLQIDGPLMDSQGMKPGSLCCTCRERVRERRREGETERVFGMLRLDPETVLILLTTTRIPGRFYRTGTVVGPCSVEDLRSCAVTSTVTGKPLFPVLDIIETEDNNDTTSSSDRSRPSGTSRS